MIGETISHYKILEKLGEGGMGVVYKARDTTLDRLVALKFLPARVAASHEDKARFVQEAKAIAVLSHPNICTIYDADESDGIMYIAMEFIDGGTLRPRLPYVKVRDAIDIATQIAEALQEAHRKGIVHRDVKPENVMVDIGGRVKVMDFGLAQLNGALRDPSSGTTGTTGYMSPEQIQGAAVDQRSDIFSFGILLYEMLAGRLPFRGEHEAAMLYSIVNEDPPPLTSLRQDVPETLERIVLRALEKDPARRFQDMHGILSQLRSVKTDSPAVSSQPLLAVLPFDTIGPNQENDYFGEGLTEEIIVSLSKLCGLKVVSRSSAMRYKGTDKSVKQIAGELRARYVLEGSVRKNDRELRITALLIDAEQDVQLWGEIYRGGLTDVFDIQEKVAGRIVRALKLRLTADERRTLKKRSTNNSDAYQLYLQGRYFWNRRTQEGLNASITYFERAIQLDPRYSLAWAGLADAYNLLASDGGVQRKELYQKATAAVDKALDIDPNLAEAHTSRGMLLMLNAWDWTAAEKEFRLAISLNRHYATAHHWYSEWLLYQGRLEQAVMEISRAVELDPVSPAIHKDKGLVHYYSRQYDEAIASTRKAMELDPQFRSAHRLLSLAFQGKRMFDEAISENERWRMSLEKELEAQLALAQIHAVAGRGEEARKICRHMDSDALERGNLYRGMALVHAALHESDLAFAWLEKGVERRDDALCSIKVDPKFDSIRSDPRFASLLQRIGLDL